MLMEAHSIGNGLEDRCTGKPGAFLEVLRMDPSLKIGVAPRKRTFAEQMVGLEQPAGYNTGAYTADTSGRDEPTGRREIDWEDTNRNELYRSSPFDAVMADVANGMGKGLEAYDAMVGGRGVRGALAGKPRELLSVIDPFSSDASGLTNPADRTTGRDLGESWGAIGKDEGFSGSLKGMGIDFLTNPGSGPTLAKIPSVAQKLGKIGLRAAGSPMAKQFMADERGMLDPLLGLGQEFDDAGLGYKTSWDDVRKMMGRSGSRIEHAAENFARANNGIADDVLNRIASEVHPDSVYLGGGVDARAFRDPNGFVTRIGAKDNYTVGDASRLANPEGMVLQPMRANDYGSFVIEQLPEVTTIGDSARLAALQETKGYVPYDDLSRAKDAIHAFTNATDGIMDALPTNVNPIDLHYGNIGVHRNGTWSIIDPGAVIADPNRRGGIDPRILDYGQANLPVGPSRQDSRLQGELARRLGEFARTNTPTPGIRFPDIDHERLMHYVDMANRRYREMTGNGQYYPPHNLSSIRGIGATPARPANAPTRLVVRPGTPRFERVPAGPEAMRMPTNPAGNQGGGVGGFWMSPGSSGQLLDADLRSVPQARALTSDWIFNQPWSPPMEVPSPQVQNSTDDIFRQALQQSKQPQQSSPVMNSEWLRRFQSGVMPDATPATRRF